MARMDVLVFGASGYTGKYVVREILKMINKHEEKFTWGVAGRNKEKLKKVLEEQGKKFNTDLSDIPIVIADIQDEESLNEMAKKAKVILNCCGPYRFYGEPVVKACVANKTHHVDISGEPQYMEKMELKYNESAKENEVYVVSACGVDSIPADLGVLFLKNNFKGEVNSADIYLDTWCSNNVKMSGLHYGTWESAVYGLAHWGELGPLRRALYPNKLPQFLPKKKTNDYVHLNCASGVLTPILEVIKMGGAIQDIFSIYMLHKNENLGKWCLPFPGSDRSVVKRTQRYLYEKENERFIQANTYIAFPNIFVALIVLLVSANFFILSKFKFGRSLLLKYPKFFSAGLASHEGPTEEQADNTHFSFTFFGEGWNEKLAEPTDNHPDKPNKKMITKVSGTNPGYGATCVALILCGLTILRESEKMPNKGGVYPPGAAFSKTNLIDNLNKMGVNFEVLQGKDEGKKEL